MPAGLSTNPKQVVQPTIRLCCELGEVSLVNWVGPPYRNLSRWCRRCQRRHTPAPNHDTLETFKYDTVDTEQSPHLILHELVPSAVMREAPRGTRYLCLEILLRQLKAAIPGSRTSCQVNKDPARRDTMERRVILFSFLTQDE
jgi:hypothetical protein